MALLSCIKGTGEKWLFAGAARENAEKQVIEQDSMGSCKGWIRFPALPDRLVVIPDSPC